MNTDTVHYDDDFDDDDEPVFDAAPVAEKNRKSRPQKVTSASLSLPRCVSHCVVILHNSVVLDLFMWYDLSSRLAFMAEFILLFMNAFSLMS